MKNRLRALSILLAVAVVWAGVGAGPAPVPEAKRTARVELHDGTSLEGELLTTPFPIRLPHGELALEADALVLLTTRAPDSTSSQDRVELADHEILRGRLLIDELKIGTADGPRSIPFGEIRELRRIDVGKSIGFGGLLLGLLMLSAMEIVLGIDNIIFLAIVAGKLPKDQQPRARRLGLFAALGTRLLLLCSLSFLLGLTKPLFTLPEFPYFQDLEAREISLRDLILLLGGMFLIGKSTMEMHESLEVTDDPSSGTVPAKATSFVKVLVQIAILDIVFSLDSVITAVGMVKELWVMMTAMVIAMLVMLAFASTVADFVTEHPTIKILALSFLVLIGVVLVAEGLGLHIEKGYIYFAMAFAVGVELINMKMRKRHRAVKLHNSEIPKN